MAALEEKYPGSPLVAELRRRLDERAAEHPPESTIGCRVAPADEAVIAKPPAKFEPADETRPRGTADRSLCRQSQRLRLHLNPRRWRKSPRTKNGSFPPVTLLPPSLSPRCDAVVPPPVTEPEAPPPADRSPWYEEPVAAEQRRHGHVGRPGRGFGFITGRIDRRPRSARPGGAGHPTNGRAAPPPRPPQGAAQLSGLLAEMEEPGAAAAAKDDPETHYNLGVAFREMGLLDEAIGEFQKVVKGAGKGNFPPNFLQACSLLAICFMEKKMPAIAVKWYLRALETPGLDEEALMALQYDLGVAYEQAGDSRRPWRDSPRSIARISTSAMWRTRSASSSRRPERHSTRCRGGDPYRLA